MDFEKTNWRQAYQWLEQKQEELIRAYKDDDIQSIIGIQVSILKNYRTTVIAVRRVAQNKGSKTPGIDRETLSTFQDLVRVAKIAHKMVCNPSTYKPSPVKRVWIPKGKNEKRPIGMPTVIDRVIQAIYLEAIDPIVEARM